MEKIRILIADDERPAREYLKRLLAEFDDVDLSGEAESGTEALEAIKSLKPDLALLDLQMPEMSGVEEVRQLRRTRMPLVAFVTAFETTEGSGWSHKRPTALLRRTLGKARRT